tara:strand:- start:306 stop:827 length:522 start_codon:yes stop_codon:yes gene_type:complete
MKHDSLIIKKIDTKILTKYGEYRLRAYEQTTNGIIHLALTKGFWRSNETILTRIHSSKITNDILGMLTGSINKGLDDIFNLINKQKKGSILFINKQEDSGDLLSRILELEKMQSKGKIDKSPPIAMDIKDFGIGAQILHDLEIKKLNVISNSKQKRRVGLTGYGLTIEGYTNY